VKAGVSSNRGLAEGLTSDDAIAAFMEEAFKTEDVGYIAHAMGVV
jgi:DNA-binding phage protein